jgi:protease YdgD
LSQVGASDIQVAPLPQATPAGNAPFPKTTAGFIPANLARSPFPFEGSRNVFGKDDRIPVNSTKYPWSAIGRVESIKGKQLQGICTGSLIGKNLVVTNAHCIVNENTKQITTNQIRFRPNLIEGKSRAEASVTRILLGTKDPRGDRGNDWAFLVLDKPLGETHGWLKFTVADLTDLDSMKNQVWLAGYSIDFPKEKPAETAGVHKGCSIRGFGSQLGTISHDCDMMAGASGGPMFVLLPDGSAVIIALNAAHPTTPTNPQGRQVSKFATETANIGVYAAVWANKAQELLKGKPLR